MATFEINSTGWHASGINVKAEQVASVAFNEASKSTEITMKPEQTCIVLLDSIPVESAAPEVIQVKGSVTEVKKQLGLD